MRAGAIQEIAVARTPLQLLMDEAIQRSDTTRIRRCGCDDTDSRHGPDENCRGGKQQNTATPTGPHRTRLPKFLGQQNVPRRRWIALFAIEMVRWCSRAHPATPHAPNRRSAMRASG
ncbi:hypothetical protein [Nocardia tengchongensis]|uniref:hypothetical protein n=1 Tax=Nocardia tengchongensis TaxID=2055889 RepID=UPI003691A88C